MKITRLTVRFRALADTPLPAFKGPMLRGALGLALIRIGCRAGRPRCDACRQREGCVYHDLFVAFQDEPPRFHNMRLPPHPYVISCADERTTAARSSAFEFTVTLIGRAAAWTPAIAMGLALVGERGLGPDRRPFILETVTAASARGDGLSVYRDHGLEIADTDRLPAISLFPPNAAVSPARRRVDAEWVFETPVRWANSVNETTPVSPKGVLKSILRRCSSLAAFWEADEWRDFPFGPLLDACDGASITDTDLRWEQGERYSTRQRRAVPLGGWVGRFAMRNVPLELVDLALAARPLHIGKGAVFGLGRYDLRELRPENR